MMNLKQPVFVYLFVSNLVKLLIYPFITVTTAFCPYPLSSYADSFAPHNHKSIERRTANRQNPTTRRWNFLKDVGALWEELIEFSTYGPGERKLLKARRAEAAAAAAKNDISVESFRLAKEQLKEGDDGSSISSKSFNEEVSMRQSSSSSTLTDVDEIFDGYTLRDLLVSRWGAPLDIEFQRGYNNKFVYCTISPVAFGSRKCRHESEIEYLCHLQGVVEILQKYNNLEPFKNFIETTDKVPKPGTDSVPFRLILTNEEMNTILGKF